MQAKDITDDAVLAAIRSEELRRGASRWDIGMELVLHVGEVPEKVVLAKLRSMEKRGLVDGCLCGCRGDFEIVAGPETP